MNLLLILISALLHHAARALALIPPPASSRPWRPFLDPIDLHDRWWLTIIPLALGISIAYKAVRVQTLERFWPRVLLMTGQVVAGMIALAVCVFLLVEVLVPWYLG